MSRGSSIGFEPKEKSPMAPLRVSTTKSEWLPDDPMAFVPTRPWKSPFITTWDDSRNQNHPTDSAEEAQFVRCFDGVVRLLLHSRFQSRFPDHPKRLFTHRPI